MIYHVPYNSFSLVIFLNYTFGNFISFLPKLAVRVAGSLLVHGQEVGPLHQEDVGHSAPGGSAQPFGRHL